MDDLISTKISIPQLIYSNERHEPWAYAIFRFMPGIHIYDASDESKISLSYELGENVSSYPFIQVPKGRSFWQWDRHKGLPPFPENFSPYFEEAFAILLKWETPDAD